MLTLKNNVVRLIDFYNLQRNYFKTEIKQNSNLQMEKILNFDNKLISWTESLLNGVKTDKEINFESKSLVMVNYRPFTKEYLYYNRKLNERVYQMPKIFPNGNDKNLVLCVQGAGDKKAFSVLISDKIADLGFNGACQCFPLYYYEENNNSQKGLFDSGDKSDYIRRDGVSDFILERAKKQYGKNVGKEDLFYYVYGFLHSPTYRETFANDLKKMLPRLPLVDDVRDFWKFSKAGRALAELHLNYETVAPYPDAIVTGDDSAFYEVIKMRFPKKDRKDTIIYNSKITISNIPAAAYEYVVNGKSAIEWIMERYQVSTHKDSGIANNPNDWATEVGNPRYILDLILSIINVSVQTVAIVKDLPVVTFE